MRNRQNGFCLSYNTRQTVMRDKEVIFMQIRANANENQVILTSSAARARAQERFGINAREQNKRNTIFYYLNK